MRHRSTRARRGALPLALLLLAGACTAPATPGDVSTGEMFVEISDALNAIRQENAMLQAQVDSLREVVARQDTLLSRVAAAAGVPR
jgi:hypothetical protein